MFSYDVRVTVFVSNIYHFKLLDLGYVQSSVFVPTGQFVN